MFCSKSEECKGVTQVALYKHQHVSTEKLFRYVFKSFRLIGFSAKAYVKLTNNGTDVVSQCRLRLIKLKIDENSLSSIIFHARVTYRV